MDCPFRFGILYLPREFRPMSLFPEATQSIDQVRYTVEEKRKTAGEASIEASLIDTGPVSIIDQQRSMQEHYIKNLQECAELFKKSHVNQNFFIVVITKVEKLLSNIVRSYFFARTSCPTPNYDEAIYRYDYKKECIQFLWIVPSRDVCFHLLENHLVIAPEERGLLMQVAAFATGELYNYCRYLNREIPDAPHLSIPKETI